MKVFIYDKSTSKKLRVIKDVKVIYESDNQLVIDTDNESLIFNKQRIKATCYQN